MGEKRRKGRRNPLVKEFVPNIDNLSDDAVVPVPVRVLRLIQEWEPPQPGLSNHREFHQNDPAAPSTPVDYSTLHRLCFGRDPDDDKGFQRMKRYLGSGLLTDREIMVMLAINCVTTPTGRGLAIKSIARAMRIQPAHVRKHKREALKKMRAAPPAELLEDRIRKSQELLRRMPPEPWAV